MTRNDRGSIRSRGRYWATVALGYGSKEAGEAARSIRRFCELVTAKGKKPEDYGELSVRLLGGKPRVDSARSRRFKAWYHELRGLGASSVDASSASLIMADYEELKATLLAAREAALDSEPSC